MIKILSNSNMPETEFTLNDKILIIIFYIIIVLIILLSIFLYKSLILVKENEFCLVKNKKNKFRTLNKGLHFLNMFTDKIVYKDFYGTHLLLNEHSFIFVDKQQIAYKVHLEFGYCILNEQQFYKSNIFNNLSNNCFNYLKNYIINKLNIRDYWLHLEQLNTFVLNEMNNYYEFYGIHFTNCDLQFDEYYPINSDFLSI